MLFSPHLNSKPNSTVFKEKVQVVKHSQTKFEKYWMSETRGRLKRRLPNGSWQDRFCELKEFSFLEHEKEVSIFLSFKKKKKKSICQYVDYSIINLNLGFDFHSLKEFLFLQTISIKMVEIYFSNQKKYFN